MMGAKAGIPLSRRMLGCGLLPGSCSGLRNVTLPVSGIRQRHEVLRSLISERPQAFAHLQCMYVPRMSLPSIRMPRAKMVDQCTHDPGDISKQLVPLLAASGRPCMATVGCHSVQCAPLASERTGWCRCWARRSCAARAGRATPAASVQATAREMPSPAHATTQSSATSDGLTELSSGRPQAS